MALECINPKDLPVPTTYTQVVVATGSKLVFVSGQEPEDINGKLVDDFHIVSAYRMTHVLNAPSPAATASLSIGKHIATLAIEGRTLERY